MGHVGTGDPSYSVEIATGTPYLIVDGQGWSSPVNTENLVVGGEVGLDQRHAASESLHNKSHRTGRRGGP